MDSSNPTYPSECVIDVTDNTELQLARSESEVKKSLQTQEEPVKILFKKPQIGVIIGNRKGKIIPKIHTSNVEQVVTESLPSNEAVSENPTSIGESNDIIEKNKDNKVQTKSPAQLLTDNTIPIPYKEPKWGGYPKSSYQFEVLKSGKILEYYDLTSRSCHIFGRLPDCDVTLLHPTISRHHAVVQYRGEEAAGESAGFYVYDLDSTHGTFLNKNRIKPRMYVRLHVGHILRFGCSTRLHLLQGPADDEEEESELTVTQIQTQRQNELIKRKLEKLRGSVGENEEAEEDGISWGMGEDADEETDLSVNPFASTANEELYLDDPKKTLRGWFEREGHDLDYDVQEKGAAQFLCQVELPIDSARGGVVVAEAMVKGKKKEAVVQCALEACRILDRYGLLRQANHESKKRKAKDWEAEDYYDSDDDTFLDRTGSVEKKRSLRMKAVVPQQALTYGTLLEQHAAVLSDLSETEARLEEAIANKKAAKKASGDEEDDLDAFMKTLKTPAPDKLLISQLKSSLTRLKVEESRVRQLVNLARPANLPELKARATSPAAVGDTAVDKMAAVFGRRRKLGSGRKRVVKNEDGPTKGSGEGIDVREEDEEEEEMKESEVSVQAEEEVGKEDKMDETEQQEMVEREAEKRRKKNRKRTLQRNFKVLKDQAAKWDAVEEDFTDWAPPQGQTGDGRTSLNDKLGY